MSRPPVSVVLVTRDGMEHLPEVWAAIAAQRGDFDVETVAVDSESTDGTSEFLAARVDHFRSIPAADFDHGGTRNLAIGMSRGEHVALLVQDATPADDEWLAALVGALRDDDTLAGCYSRQLPRPGASALTRYYLARWVAAGDRPYRRSLDGASLADLAPPERMLACAFDDVSSCLRRSVWERHPFAETPIAEDLEWGKAVLEAGHALAFVPGSAVVHSHERSLAYELDRTYELHRRLYRLFGLRNVPSAAHLLRAIAVSTATNLRCVAAGPRGDAGLARELARALGLAVVSPWGQYRGARSAFLEERRSRVAG